MCQIDRQCASTSSFFQAICRDLTGSEVVHIDFQALLKEKRGAILDAAKQHGARNVRVFGSVARGDFDEKSDLDLLVEMEPGSSLLDHASLQLDLESLLGCKVDVVSDKGIKARIRDRVLREARPL